MNKKDLAINLFLTFLSACLIYSAVFIFSSLIWFAFIPLFFLTWTNSFRRLIWFALLQSFFIAIASSYWVVSFDEMIFYLFTLYVCSYFFLYTIFLNLLLLKIKNIFSIFIPGLFYVLIFVFYSSNNVGAYWFNLAILQPRFSFVVNLLGELGMMFLVLTVNSLIFFIFINKRRKECFVFLILIISVLFSAHYYGQHKLVDGRRIRVAIVQGNFTQDWDWRAENSAGLILEKYTKLSRDLAEEKPDLIVWPEYAIPTNLGFNKDVYNKISDLAKELNANMIVGSMVNDGMITDNNELHYFDSAFAFNRKGEEIGRYDALHPFPYKTKNSVGDGYLVFETDAGRIGIAICYDEVIDKVFRDYNKLGVDYFVGISNNSPVKNYFTMRWRKYFAELRAATYKKYFIQSTNSGYSQVVDPFGEVIESIPAYQEGTMVTDIYLGR